MNFSKMTVKDINNYLKNLNVNEIQQELTNLKNDSRSSIRTLITKYEKQIEKHYKEQQRIKKISQYENILYNKGIKYIAGVDEAGRGPLAGSVYAAAVIFPKDIFIEGINDSKKLSEKKREKLYDIIIERAISYSIKAVDQTLIDKINIRNATHMAMVEAVKSLNVSPEYVLVDGDYVKGMPVKHKPIVNGDSLSISIAAASILAKVSRDRYIRKYDSIYPQYGFASHKGYGTKQHIEAIKKYGITPLHRKTFCLKFINT